MGLIRSCRVMLVALALAIGAAGFAQAAGLVPGAAGDATAVAHEPAMPDCAACDPDKAMAPTCIPVCTGLAAILPAPVMVATGRLADDRSAGRTGSPTGVSAGPEPYPPRAALLA